MVLFFLREVLLKINGSVTVVLMLACRDSTYVLESTKQVNSNGLFPHIS